MGIHVERLGYEPIVILTITEPTDRLDLELDHACEEVAALMADCVNGYYRITDFSAANINFSSLMMKIAHETQGTPGTLSDPNAIPVFVGSHELIAMTVNALMQDQYGNTHVTECATIGEAIRYAQANQRLAGD